MSVSDPLPQGYDRHREALFIVDPGACNPSGVALAIFNACRQVRDEGGDVRTDPAVRLMTTQLAFLVRGDSGIDDYDALIETCRARAGERAGASTP